MIRSFKLPRILPLVLVLLSPVSRLAAQEDSGTVEKPTLFFEVVYWGDWMERPLKFKSNNDLKAIPLQNGSATCYLYGGASPLVFYRDEAVDPVTKELKPVPILSLPFQSSWRRAVLLITPNKAKGEDGLSAQLVPLIADTFPPDSVYLVNAAGKNLKCKLADKTWEMKPDEKSLYPVPPDASKVYMLAASEWKGNWQVMLSDSFRTGAGERRVVYFHTPAGTEGVAALSAVIPPDSARFDSKGRPVESAAVDPDFKPGADPTGTGTYTPAP